MNKLKTFSIIVLITLITSLFVFGASQALQFEKRYRGNVLFHGIVRSAMPSSGPNRGYWANTTGQFRSTFATKTDTAKFFNLDFDYQDDTGGETAYGFYLNFDDNVSAPSASTFYMMAITSEGDANSTSYGMWIDPNWTVGIDCDSPVELDSLDLEPATNIDALDIIGTNITTASHIDMDVLNVSGSVITMDYTSAKTLTGDLKGFEVDLSTNVTLSDQNLIGFSLVMPGTFGAGSEHGLLITGDGQTIGICDDAVGLSIDEGTAGDALSLSVGTAGDVQAIVVDATTLDSTSTAGMVDINWDSATTGASGINLAMTSVDDDAADTLYGIDIGVTVADDTTATDTIYGQRIDITQNDTTGTGVGLYVSANDSGAGVVTTGILVANLQSSDIDLTDGILIETVTNNSMPDAIDVSDSDITNAINVGTNTIIGTTAVIDFTDFDVDADGKTILAPDTAGDAFTVNFGAADDFQAMVVDASTNDSTNTTGIIDINWDSATTGASGINLAMTSVDDDAADTLYGIDIPIIVADDTTATDTIYGQRIDITQNDTDGTGIGLLVSANDTGTSVVTAGIVVDNLQATDIDMTDGIVVQALTADSIVDGLDVSDAELTNAVNVGANDIEGTDATITFTDFQVAAEGLTTIAPDSAGDALTLTGFAGDFQAIVIDAATADSTNTSGIIDIGFDSATTGASGINLAFTSVDDDAADTLYGIDIPIVVADDTTATDTIYGQRIDITQNDTDGTGVGLFVSANDDGAGVVTAGIRVDNLQATDIDMTDGIIVAAVTADSIVDGIDVSDAELTNAVNVGANDIEGTDATITFTDFQVAAEGLTTIAPDSAGDALTLTGFAGDFQAIVIDAATADSTNTDGIFDLNYDTNVAGIGIDIALTCKDDDAADTITGINQTITVEADSTAADIVYGHHIDITQNDTDAGAGIGLYVTANDAGAGVVEAGIKIHNDQATDIDMTDGIIIIADTAGSMPDGIDVSSTNIDNAINVGDNDIEGTTATLTFTDISIDSDGKIATIPDTAGDILSIGIGAVADMQALVIDGTTNDSTATAGIIDLNYDTSTSTASGINIAFTAVDDDAADTLYGIDLPIIIQDDTTADDTVYGMRIDITQNDDDNPIGTGLYISNNDSGTNGELLAGIIVENLQVTDIDIEDGVLVRAATADSIVDAFDASDAEITNALNVGANDIEGTDATITFTDFQVAAEGLTTIAPDSAGDALTLTGFAGDFQAIVVDAATADSTNTSGIIDIDFDSATTGASGINLAFTSVDDDAADTLYGITIPVTIQADTTAADTVYGYHVDITQNDTDAPAGVGLYIVNNDSGAGELSSGILIENAQSTDIDMDAGIVIQATTAGSIPTAIDISDAEITDGINIGENLITGNVEITGLFQSDLYHWKEEFDDEVSAVQFENGLVADFWVTGGTNYAAANVTYEEGIGGTLEVDTAGSDSDSVTILGAANFRVDSNPKVEFRFKVDDVTTCFAMCGLVEGSFVSKDAPDDDIYLVGLDADNGHTFGATTIVALSNNDNAGALYDNCTVTMSNDTYIVVRFDLTDVSQPRVWINGTEVSAAALLDTVQAGTTLMPYIMVESLAGPATPRTLTIDYIRAWQDRG